MNVCSIRVKGCRYLGSSRYMVCEYCETDVMEGEYEMSA